MSDRGLFLAVVPAWRTFAFAALAFAAGGASGADLPLSMPGALVDAGGHRLHIHCLGEGGPAVIMDAGLGGTSLEWVGVQRRLARHVTACVYDRAGYGWSEPGPGPRTSSRIADELYVLLRNAGIEGRYVLVGHSFGGYNVQLFAHRYPYLTAGLVLVDASHPEQVERFRRPPIGLNTAPRTQRGLVSFSRPPDVPASMPEGLRAAALRLVRTAKARQAVKEEFLQFETSAAQVREAGALPEVPMVVLTHGQRVWPQGHRGNLIEDLWMRLQDELAAQTAHAAHIVAAASGHHVHLDQPELVSDAILMVVDFARSEAPTGPALAGTAAVAPARAADWLAFDNAWWRYDSLHPALRLSAPDPFLYARGGGVRAGHFAGTPQPELQQVVYYEE